MGIAEVIVKMAKENNGIVTTAMVVAAGFSRGNIKYLVDKGMIEKSARGVYILPEVWDDEIFNLLQSSQRKLHFPCAGLRQLPLCGLAAQNYLTLQTISVRQVFCNPTILFQWDSV